MQTGRRPGIGPGTGGASCRRSAAALYLTARAEAPTGAPSADHARPLFEREADGRPGR